MVADDGIGVKLMARLALAAACCVLAVGTAAEAQVTGVSGASTTTGQFDGSFGPFTNTGPGLVSQGPGNGAAYYGSFSSTPSIISFESANASSGPNILTNSTTSVDITIKNGGSTPVLPTLQSTITAGGLGLYLADRTGACGGSGLFGKTGDPFGGCGQVKAGTFQDLRQVGDINQSVAGAAFEFKVVANKVTVYDLTGVETLFISDGGGLQVSGLRETLTIGGVSMDPTGVLQGLAEVTPGAPDTAAAFLWNASDVNIALGGALAAHASEDVVYSSTVSTFSREGCATADLSECLVPFAAFGDPIGKGGGISGAAVRTLGPGFDIGPLAGSSDGFPFVDNWAPQSFRFPTFVGGVLTFQAGVPEPKTWMSLILGFGLLGAALRRRRVLGYT
jgi:hypothetical protein